MGTLSFSPSAQRLALGASVLALGLVALRCSVDIPSNQPFSCATDADCGGEGYSCVTGASAKFCCKVDSEVCDGIDNDCDGVVDNVLPVGCYSGQIGTEGVGLCRIGHRNCINGQLGDCIGDVTPAAEICDGQDNDCDSIVDDGIDKMTDPNNCDTCGHVCAPAVDCIRGFCGGPPPESVCYDGLDDDRNGDTDCADSACFHGRCKSLTLPLWCNDQKKCVCPANDLEPPLPAETASDCLGGLDADCDNLVSCADPHCGGQSCGTGCVCCGGKNCGTGCTCSGAVATETDCSDGLNNDSDATTDCADIADCNGKSCGTGCTCCGGKSCGTGCTCTSGLAKETNCADSINNDGDATTDCGDSDCQGQPCDGSGGTCKRVGGVWGCH